MHNVFFRPPLSFFRRGAASVCFRPLESSGPTAVEIKIDTPNASSALDTRIEEKQMIAETTDAML